MEQFETEVDYWEHLYPNLRCVYNDDKRVFYVKIWGISKYNVVYIPCLIDNISTYLIL